MDECAGGKSVRGDDPVSSEHTTFADLTGRDDWSVMRGEGFHYE